jgi:hypothetical protein
VICLGVAILMVVWGQFFLPPTADPILQVLFWSVCFITTVAAIFIAFADLRALRTRTQAEKRALLEETIHAIEKEVSHAASRQ